jgi:hypothetical protein
LRRSNTMFLAEHFKKHGAVHALWLFTVMTFIIAALLLRLPNGTTINNYISFSASLASLILALVAIFYSMISNQSFSETIGSIKNSISDLGEVTASVNSASSLLTDRSDLLISEIASFKPTMENISSNLSAQADSEINIKDRIVEKSEQSSGIIKESPSQAGMLSLYILAKSELSGKKFSLEDIFPDNVVWNNYCTGFIEAVKTIQPSGIKLDKIEEKLGKTSESDQERIKYTYQISDKGSADFHSLLSLISRSSYENWPEYQPLVDKYF